MVSPYQEFLAKARARKENSGALLGSASSLIFTKHAEYKMKQYGLSVQKVRGVIRNPKRKEVGIVPHTVAVMQPVALKKLLASEPQKSSWQRPVIKNAKGESWSQEIWALYKEHEGKKKIISAWRYPGMSPKREPIPEEILQELLEMDA
jgi:hypothetical protein